MAYSLYVGGVKVRTVTHKELADAERKMAISRLVNKAEEYWGKSMDIKHPGLTYTVEQWPGASYPIQPEEDKEDIIDPELFEWEEED